MPIWGPCVRLPYLETRDRCKLACTQKETRWQESSAALRKQLARLTLCDSAGSAMSEPISHRGAVT